MADRQHGLSRTLPKDFTYPSAGQAEPRTPERASIQLDAPPPPPRHSCSRLRQSRVRSGTDLFFQGSYDCSTYNSTASDIPLPSIEFPPTADASAAQPQAMVAPPDNQFLAPPRARIDLRTPPAQIRPDPIEAESAHFWSAWDPQTAGDAISRPGSACSNASDSSVSSIETFSSQQSVGGSCTSTESDTHDPFVHIDITPKQTAEVAPLPKKHRSSHRKPLKTKERWTSEMENHLWNTYQLYLQDPTITPFKMTPGSIPPLGVTHRVAREAKRSWNRNGIRLDKQFPSRDAASRSGDSTLTARDNAPKPAWPKSESSTRRKLKSLCKKKLSIAPHYQRMMQSRSPTPFMDLLSRPLDAAPPRANASIDTSTVYATRDLGVSLVSSAIPAPLAQLAVPDPLPETRSESPRPRLPGSPRRDNGRSLPTKASSFDERGVAPRLGSPFSYHTWGPNHMRKRNQRPTPRARRETIHVTGSRLRSPAQMDPLPNIVNSTNVRSSVCPESPTEQETRRNLEELFRQGKLNDIGHRRVRIRNRGATMSAITPKGADQLFSPPSSSSRNEETSSMEKPIPNPLLDLSGENIKRLGSPFKMEGFRRTHPSGRISRHAPSLSDPFASGVLPPFRSMPHYGPSGSQITPTGSLPYDPTEEGITDAERIRRQILNMPYLRR
ncbi:uncharacterized protein BJX67DRAFT_212824 [Aspergillus lucknowensis]|uniref:Uncharacterized protein n=1 Tax=Aspergillus lucknowensis TaxID=176173 RepID=A0ABR4M2G8_9EURO